MDLQSAHNKVAVLGRSFPALPPSHVQGVTSTFLPGFPVLVLPWKSLAQQPSCLTVRRTFPGREHRAGSACCQEGVEASGPCAGSLQHPGVLPTPGRKTGRWHRGPHLLCPSCGSLQHAKLWLGRTQRACAPFASFFSVLGWLFSMLKCDFFAISCSFSKLVSGAALDGPVLPWLCSCRQLRRHFALGAFFSTWPSPSRQAAYKLCTWKMGPESSRHQ